MTDLFSHLCVMVALSQLVTRITPFKQKSKLLKTFNVKDKSIFHRSEVIAKKGGSTDFQSNLDIRHKFLISRAFIAKGYLEEGSRISCDCCDTIENHAY